MRARGPLVRSSPANLNIELRGWCRWERAAANLAEHHKTSELFVLIVGSGPFDLPWLGASQPKDRWPSYAKSFAISFSAKR
jgi:hypothetical protein